MGIWKNWKLRHQHPASLILHVVGIPLTIVAAVVAGLQLLDGRWDLWWRPTVLFIGGYLLQWIGHRIEGNTMGEVILIRRWRDQPYVAIAPQYSDQPTDGKPPA